jgi:hypothetical protein
MKRLLPLVVSGLLVSACDLPTDLPRFDTRWETVLLRDSVATGELLPDNVRLHPDGGFVVDSFSVVSEIRLQDVCELCTCFEGPIPALEITPYDWRFQLPPRVLEVPVERGTAEVTLHNETGFDVLDDGEGNRGWLDIQLVDTRSEDALDSVRIDTSLPHGDSTSVTFDLEDVVLGSQLVARVSGRTPGSGCDTVDLDLESGFRTEVRLRDLRAPSVRVVISDADLAVPPRTVELPEAVADRLRPGEAEVGLEVEVEPRLPVSSELTLSVARDAPLLFTDSAALYTPLVLPAATPGAGEAPVIRKTFLLDLEGLEAAERLIVDTRSRILDNRIVTLEGGESVRYLVRVLAELPVR